MEERLDRLELALGEAAREIDRLASREKIRDCFYRAARAIDRVDEELLLSAFLPGATIDYGRIFQGAVEDWAVSAMQHQASQSQRQHLVGNILIQLNGDSATAESYELDRHKTPTPLGMRDLVLSARTLDRLVRRDGQWRIAARKKVTDWGRAITADEAVYENSPLDKGGSDRSDASYALFS